MHKEDAKKSGQQLGKVLTGGGIASLLVDVVQGGALSNNELYAVIVLAVLMLGLEYLENHAG